MPSIVIEEDDIIENAQTNQIIVHKADLTPKEEDDLAEESKQPESDGTADALPDYEIDEDETPDPVFEFLETEYSQEEKQEIGRAHV